MAETSLFQINASLSLDALTNRRLGDAFVGLRAMLADDTLALKTKSSATGRIAAELAEVEANYARMCRYFAQGYADAEREQLYAGFLQHTARLFVETSFEAALADSRSPHALMARTLRSMASRPTLESICANGADGASPELLFDVVWTSGPWREAEADAVTALFDRLPAARQALLVSAAALGALSCFDPLKLRFIIEAAALPEPAVQARAIVGVVCVLARSSSLARLFPDTLDLWTTVACDPLVAKGIGAVQACLAVCLATNRAERRLTEEIMPGIIEASRKVSSRGHGVDIGEILQNPLAAQANPDWGKQQESLQKGLDEVAEMQKRGVDVMYSMFKQLAQFPFFAKVAHWFAPFDLTLAGISPDAGTATLLQLLDANPAITETDKFALSLMWQTMQGSHAAQMEALQQQFDQNADALSHLRHEASQRSEAQVLAEQIRRYCADLYRFFTLFPNSFFSKEISPFKAHLLLTDFPEFAPLFEDEGVCRRLAETLFGVERYDWALAFYERCEPTADTLEHCGFCLRATGKQAEAAEAFERALLLRPDSPWGLLQLAAARQTLQQFSKAAECYEALLRLDNTDATAARRLGEMRLLNGETAEARTALFQAYYLAPNDTAVLRALAWCCLQQSDTDEAEKFYARLTALPDAQPSDFQSAGHTAFIRRELPLALQRYQEFAKRAEADGTAPALFADDSALLLSQGISHAELNIMEDALRLADDAPFTR